MTVFFQGLLFCIGGAAFFICGVLAMAICVRSGQISREEEAEGAPEGALIFNHFQCPDASCLKLSVRASYQSVRSVDG